jgi:hypothetical protein
MGDDGLKWKDGAFLGLSDYLAQENAKDHFYKTEEEKNRTRLKRRNRNSPVRNRQSKTNRLNRSRFLKYGKGE